MNTIIKEDSHTLEFLKSKEKWHVIYSVGSTYRGHGVELRVVPTVYNH